MTESAIISIAEFSNSSNMIEEMSDDALANVINGLSDDALANVIKALSASRQRVITETLPLIGLRTVSEMINTTYQTTKVLRYRRERERDSYPAPDRLPPDVAMGTGIALYLRSEVEDWGIKCGRIVT